MKVFDGENRRAVVVGSSGGIGAALLEALERHPAFTQVYGLQRDVTGTAGSDARQYLPINANDTASLASAANTIAQEGPVHLLINAVGCLSQDSRRPEKRLRDLQPEALQGLYHINAIFPGLLASAFEPLLKHAQPAMFASLSARVGSIGDNASGGWHGYRMSKAAHNMLLRCIAAEWRVSHPNATVIALHPGTVATSLSVPYIPKNYARTVLSPSDCATHLLQVLAQRSTADSGSFYGWDGDGIPW